VVWAVFKGSLRNKLILVPAALAISAFAPWAVTPLLMAGGLFLAYEGFEKVWHKLAHRDKEAEAHGERVKALTDPAVDLVALEQDKIRGAVRTDFILSAEIIVIAMGTVSGEPLVEQLAVLATIAVAMTVGVYGLVAAIIKMDDAGLFLSRKGGAFTALGRLLLRAAPALMKFLSVAGTVAMFLVGGGILTHGIGPFHHAIESLGDRAAELAGAGPVLAMVVPALANALVGVVAGALILLVVTAVSRLFRASRSAAVH
jgi:predicted DNA repair protein MutK